MKTSRWTATLPAAIGSHEPPRRLQAPTDRERYVRHLRRCYLEGTLDRVLLPAGVHVPEFLLRELFPVLYPPEEPMA